MVEAWRVAQGLEPDSHWVGDVWGGLVPLAIMIRGWESTLTRLARHERLAPPAAVGRDAQGRVTVEVFPQSRTDQVLFMGYSGRVRLQPGTSVAEVASRPATPFEMGSSRPRASPCSLRPATSPSCRPLTPSRCCSGTAARS